MSKYWFLSSDVPLESYSISIPDGSYEGWVSIEDLEALGIDLPNYWKTDYLFQNRTAKLIWMPNNSLCIIPDDISPHGTDVDYVGRLHSRKRHHAGLELDFLDERAEEPLVVDLISYIKKHLQNTDEIELWNVWLDCEYEESTITVRCSINSFSIDHIKEFRGHSPLDRPRPYCLIISKY
ncbi:MAG: hypothetical protein FWC93_05030 [Defluviitaleaceae bacterium]|nr:hypothetical protein [Defluviitaleaceae bacterium]